VNLSTQRQNPYFADCRQSTDEMRVCQDLANSSDFHLGVLSLNFQLLRRAAREGGAYDVRAATPL
jgi:hypothetical protein